MFVVQRTIRSVFKVISPFINTTLFVINCNRPFEVRVRFLIVWVIIILADILIYNAYNLDTNLKC